MYVCMYVYIYCPYVRHPACLYRHKREIFYCAFLLAALIYQNNSKRSEVSTRAQTSWYGFWVYISRASKFSSLLFLATRATSPGAASSKVVPSLKVIMQVYTLYDSAGLCSPGKSIFARPKMIAPSWLKVICPFADIQPCSLKWPVNWLVLAFVLLREKF